METKIVELTKADLARIDNVLQQHLVELIERKVDVIAPEDFASWAETHAKIREALRR